MTQSELNRAVARATGECLQTVSDLGFGLADPLEVDYDPEPSDPVDKFLDWDAVDAERLALLSCPG
jgi:hypothetical protein